jgi:hypothetical protein
MVSMKIIDIPFKEKSMGELHAFGNQILVGINSLKLDTYNSIKK